MPDWLPDAITNGGALVVLAYVLHRGFGLFAEAVADLPARVGEVLRPELGALRKDLRTHSEDLRALERATREMRPGLSAHAAPPLDARLASP